MTSIKRILSEIFNLICIKVTYSWEFVGEFLHILHVQVLCWLDKYYLYYCLKQENFMMQLKSVLIYEKLRLPLITDTNYTVQKNPTKVNIYVSVINISVRSWYPEILKKYSAIYTLYIYIYIYLFIYSFIYLFIGTILKGCQKKTISPLTSSSCDKQHHSNYKWNTYTPNVNKPKNKPCMSSYQTLGAMFV